MSWTSLKCALLLRRLLRLRPPLFHPPRLRRLRLARSLREGLYRRPPGRRESNNQSPTERKIVRPNDWHERCGETDPTSRLFGRSASINRVLALEICALTLLGDQQC